MKPNVIGLIPAAGTAKRISPLPGSKELFPIGFREVEYDGHTQIRPKVISQYLVDNMFTAGASKIWMVLGRGKWDIMQYYGEGVEYGGPIAYLLMDRSWGMPYTLDQVYPWLNQEVVLFGMPDTIFTPPDTFTLMLDRHINSKADVTLGIFPTGRPEKLCPVELNKEGKVIGMIDKPEHSEIKNTWGCACWSWKFTELMHEYLIIQTPPSREVVLADVFREAIVKGLMVNGLYFKDGEYIDIGTPDDLVDAVHRFSEQ
jgi:glucose-1-phosphate thymidylyltransferase